MSHAHQSATVSLTTVHLCSCVNGLICLTPGRLRRAEGEEGGGGACERLGWGGRGEAPGTYLCPRVSAIVSYRAQELCESRGAHPRLPVPNSSYSLCGRKATLTLKCSVRAQELCQ